MSATYLRAAVLFVTLMSAAFAVSTYRPTLATQIGYPGVGMELVETKERLAARVQNNKMPAPLPPAPAEGQLAVDGYKNVQVLGHLTTAQVTRLMTAMTTWVAPQQGCAYCHAPLRDANGKIALDEEGYVLADLNNMHSDEVYAKVVARRML